MFRIITIFISMNVILLASYSKALNYYKSGDYSDAITEAKSSKKEYSNPNLHLLWAYSAQKLGRLNEAMNAYERTLLLDESNTKAQKALNHIYKKTNRYSLLKDHNNLGKVNTRVSLSFGFDNNLAATPDSDVLQDYFGDTVQSDKKSSPFVRFTGSLGYTDDFKEKGAWYAKYLLKAYAQNNFDEDFYNLQTFSLEAGLGYNAHTYNLYFPLGYHKINYLDKALFSQYRLHPKLLIPIGNDKMLDINLIYAKNHYVDSEDSIKDDTMYAVEFGNYFLFDENYISTHIKYEQHSAINALPSKYIGADFLTLKLAAKYKFTPKILGVVNYRFRYGQYDDQVGTSITTRDDNFHQLDTTLSYQWSKKSNLFLSNTYSENKSNYPAAVYQKNSVLMGVDYSY